MRQMPLGYTYKDLAAVVGILFLTAFVIAMFSHPFQKIHVEYDELRHDDMRNVMESLITMQQRDEESFAKMVGMVAGGRTILSEEQVCTGDFGPLCMDEITQDHCASFDDIGLDAYMQEMPKDPKREETDPYSGYYLEFKEDTLYIGACAPEGTDEMVIWASLQNLP